MFLKDLSASLLVSELKSLVGEERRIILKIIHYLHEIEVRKLHLEAGYPSLFEYCVKELGYSEGAAHRRLSAMRLIQAVPEVESKIETGKLSLTVAAQAQGYFRAVSKSVGPVPKAEKLNLLEKLEGRSTRECERQLAALAPVLALPKDETRPLSDEHTLIQFVADKSLMEKITRIQELMAHQNFNGNYAQLFHLMANLVLKKTDPMSNPVSKNKAQIQKKTQIDPPEHKNLTPLNSSHGSSDVKGSELGNSELRPSELRYSKQRSNSDLPTTEGPKFSRYISKEVRREVWVRDKGQCTYLNPQSKRRCSSTYALQLDHCLPWSRGGTGSAQNLRLLCGAHNRFRAERMGLKRPARSSLLKNGS